MYSKPDMSNQFQADKEIPNPQSTEPLIFQLRDCTQPPLPFQHTHTEGGMKMMYVK